jgi:hypothetical protein
MVLTQFAWTFATAVVVGFGAAIGWRKGTQAVEALDRASSAVSAGVKQKVDRTVAGWQDRSGAVNAGTADAAP